MHRSVCNSAPLNNLGDVQQIEEVVIVIPQERFSWCASSEIHHKRENHVSEFSWHGDRLRHMFATVAGILEEHRTGGAKRAMALRRSRRQWKGRRSREVWPSIEARSVKEPVSVELWRHQRRPAWRCPAGRPLSSMVRLLQTAKVCRDRLPSSASFGAGGPWSRKSSCVLFGRQPSRS